MDSKYRETNKYGHKENNVHGLASNLPELLLLPPPNDAEPLPPPPPPPELDESPDEEE